MFALFSSFLGQVDCETASIGQYGSFDCLNKDDFVMVLNPYSTAQLHNSNPMYLNLYQAKKIFRDDREFSNNPVDVNSEIFRHKIILDYRFLRFACVFI